MQDRKTFKISWSQNDLLPVLATRRWTSEASTSERCLIHRAPERGLPQWPIIAEPVDAYWQKPPQGLAPVWGLVTLSWARYHGRFFSSSSKNLRWVRRSVIWNRLRLQKLLLYIKKSRFRYASDQHASCVRCFVHIQLEGGPRADARERLCLLAGLGMPLCPPRRWLGSRRTGHLCSDCPHFPLLTQINGRKWIG